LLKYVQKIIIVIIIHYNFHAGYYVFIYECHVAATQ